jgi:hypothetical protein
MHIDSLKNLVRTNKLLRHAATCYCTAFAAFSAVLAMIHFMLATFFSTFSANIGTQQTNSMQMRIASGNGLCRVSTHISTFQIQQYAINHWLGIVFFQTQSSALQASRSTFATSV